MSSQIPSTSASFVHWGKIRIDETKAQDFLGEISIFGCMKHVSTGSTLLILIYLRATYSKKRVSTAVASQA